MATAWDEKNGSRGFTTQIASKRGPKEYSSGPARSCLPGWWDRSRVFLQSCDADSISDQIPGLPMFILGGTIGTSTRGINITAPNSA